MLSMDLSSSIGNFIQTSEAELDNESMHKKVQDEKDSLNHLRQVLQSMRAPNGPKPQPNQPPLVSMTSEELNVQGGWNTAFAANDTDVVEQKTAEQEDIEEEELQIEDMVSGRTTPRTHHSSPQRETRPYTRERQTNRRTPKNKVGSGRSPPKMVFGRRMSTALDHKARETPTFGTNAFDKRMEMETPDGGDSIVGEGEGDGVNKGQQYAGGKTIDRFVQSAGPSSMVGKMSNDGAMDNRVVQRTHGGRSTVKTPSSPSKQGSTQLSMSTRSPTRRTPNKTLAPSPPKDIASFGRLSQVPHSDHTRIRKWEKHPFT